MKRKEFFAMILGLPFIAKAIVPEEKSLPQLMKDASNKIGQLPDYIITTPKIYEMYEKGIYNDVTFSGNIEIGCVCALNWETIRARPLRKKLRKNEVVGVRISEDSVQTRGMVSAKINRTVDEWWKVNSL
jgi:hypothetical protein